MSLRQKSIVSSATPPGSRLQTVLAQGHAMRAEIGLKVGTDWKAGDPQDKNSGMKDVAETFYKEVTERIAPLINRCRNYVSILAVKAICQVYDMWVLNELDDRHNFLFSLNATAQYALSELQYGVDIGAGVNQNLLTTTDELITAINKLQDKLQEGKTNRHPKVCAPESKRKSVADILKK